LKTEVPLCEIVVGADLVSAVESKPASDKEQKLRRLEVDPSLRVRRAEADLGYAGTGREMVCWVKLRIGEECCRRP
jgi:hypothetical protein